MENVKPKSKLFFAYYIVYAIYTLFILTYIISTLSLSSTQVIFVDIFIIIWLALTLTGISIIYFKNNLKLGVKFIRIKAYIKYIFFIILLTLFLFIIMLIQSCAKGFAESLGGTFDETTRIPFIIVFILALIIITFYFISFLRVIREINSDINKQVLTFRIIVMIFNILMFIFLTFDLISYFINPKDTILLSYQSVLIEGANGKTMMPFQIVTLIAIRFLSIGVTGLTIALLAFKLKSPKVR